jgi:hypothetical protein
LGFGQVAGGEPGEMRGMSGASCGRGRLCGISRGGGGFGVGVEVENEAGAEAIGPEGGSWIEGEEDFPHSPAHAAHALWRMGRDADGDLRRQVDEKVVSVLLETVVWRSGEIEDEAAESAVITDPCRHRLGCPEGAEAESETAREEEGSEGAARGHRRSHSRLASKRSMSD